MGKKNKKQKFYVQLRSEGTQLRSIEAVDEKEAIKIATERFGGSENGINWVIGTLHRNGDQIKPWENRQLKYI